MKSVASAFLPEPPRLYNSAENYIGIQYRSGSLTTSLRWKATQHYLGFSLSVYRYEAFCYLVLFIYIPRYVRTRFTVACLKRRDCFTRTLRSFCGSGLCDLKRAIVFVLACLGFQYYKVPVRVENRYNRYRWGVYYDIKKNSKCLKCNLCYRYEQNLF